MTNIKLLKNKRVADTWRHLDALGYEVCPLTGDVRAPRERTNTKASGTKFWVSDIPEEELLSPNWYEDYEPLEFTAIGELTHYPPDDPSAS